MQLIADGEGWMEMIASRNQSSHTFDCDVAQAIAQKVTQRYFGLFSAFSRRMQALIDADGTPL